MRLECSVCNGRISIFSVGEDNVVALCEGCGRIFDLEMKSYTTKRKYRKQDKQKDWLLSDEGKEWLTASLLNGKSVTEICKDIGMTRGSFYNYVNRYDELRKIWNGHTASEGCNDGQGTD